MPVYQPVSKFTSVRLGCDFVMDEYVPGAPLTALVTSGGGALVQAVKILDVFEDESLGDKRSVALGVIAQDVEHTLEDAQIDELSSKIVEEAKNKFGAVLRS